MGIDTFTNIYTEVIYREKYTEEMQACTLFRTGPVACCGKQTDLKLQ